MNYNFSPSRKSGGTWKLKLSSLIQKYGGGGGAHSKKKLQRIQKCSSDVSFQNKAIRLPLEKDAFREFSSNLRRS